MKKMRKSRLKGILTAKLHFNPDHSSESQFKRADLVFSNVKHGKESYEVWAYLNNPKASDRTPRDINKGYAGRFIVFGHGGCFGDRGHCDYSTRKYSTYDLRYRHPLTPVTKIITVTRALNYVLDQDKWLQSVTLVPIIKRAKRKDSGRDSSIMNFEDMALRLYS